MGETETQKRPVETSLISQREMRESKNQKQLYFSPTKPNFKIYTLIDVSCSTCIISLEKWDKFQLEVKKLNVAIIPVCYAKDKFELLKYL